MADSRTPQLWSCNRDEEQLRATTIADAVDEWYGWSTEPVPEHVVVYGFAPVELPRAEHFMSGDLLEIILERLDEDHGNPEEYTEPTEGMKEAERMFVRAVLDEYHVWQCEQVCEKRVRVRDYITAEEEVSEDDQVMTCGHKGRSWSSEWKRCMECAGLTAQETEGGE